MKEVEWEGNSLDVIKEWPVDIRINIGGDIRRLQNGERPLDWKPFPGLVENAFELRDKDEQGLYRAIYVTIYKDKVYILHCFKKTSEQTEQKDVNTANERLKRLRERQQTMARANAKTQKQNKKGEKK